MKKIEIRNKEIQKICSAKNKEIGNKEIFIKNYQKTVKIFAV